MPKPDGAADVVGVGKSGKDPHPVLVQILEIGIEIKKSFSKLLPNKKRLLSRGLYYISFTIVIYACKYSTIVIYNRNDSTIVIYDRNDSTTVIYDCNDSTILIYDRNDSGQYCKTII